MSNTLKGITAGLVATLVLSAIMLLKAHLDVAQDYTAIAMLSRLAGGAVSAWLDHFIVGVLVWGLLFAEFDAAVTMPYWLKGLGFGVFAWLMMMLLFMPIGGLGLFGLKAGFLPAAVNLAQHLIYGVVLGVTYGLLTAWVPAKAPAGSRPA